MTQESLRVRLARRSLVLAWLWFLATVCGVAFRGVVDPATTAFMQQRHLDLLSKHRPADIDYHWTPYEDIAPDMRLAVVTAEDQQFPYHHGFDWDAMGSAFTHNAKSRRVHGGSTISQQTAKNLWLWPGRSYGRKLVEAWFTVLIEAEWPKRRILEMYLNVAQLDDASFGVGAVSRSLFGVTPARLSREQAALLAASLPAPDIYDVTDPSAHLQRRQDWILDQMSGLGGADYLSDVDAGR
ncbi:MAG: monofunctional biosynthetic peptidoglycan transglycosylase [Gammaproteobacteria bacterium]